MSQKFKNNSEHQTGIITKERTKVKRPRMYNVLLLNDDFTPMEFVVKILKSVFGKDHTAATEIMLAVHTKGRGLCGTYTYEVAETKVAQVHSSAKKEGHPLQSVMEKE
jgi:ATP-dependent Clp protease adaptor protein ClpS